MRLALAAVALVLVAASCGNAVVTDECRRRISDCQARCPPGTTDVHPERGFGIPIDTRSDCERRCQELCYP